MTRRFPLHVHISTLFIALILLVGGVIGGLGFKISRDILETTASDLNTRIGRETVGEFSNLISPAEMATRLLSYDGITQAKSLEERLRNVGFMREALNNSPALTSLYVGYGNGDFFMVRRIWNEADGKIFNAPPQTAFMIQSIDRQDERHAAATSSSTLDSPPCAAMTCRIMRVLRSAHPRLVRCSAGGRRPDQDTALPVLQQPQCRHDDRQPREQGRGRGRRRHPAGNARPLSWPRRR